MQVLGFREGMNADGQVVLEREPSVAGHVVGVRVRLDDPHEPDVPPLGLLEVLLDREGRVDDGSDAGALVADEVGRTRARHRRTA